MIDFLKRHFWIVPLILVGLIALFIFVRREVKEDVNPADISPTIEDTIGTSTDESMEDLGSRMAARFRYPEELPTTYITGIDWPPDIFLNEEAYSCTEAGEVAERAGKTEERTVNDHTYCVTTIEEGAAGSVYTQYAYQTEKDGKVFTFTFSTRRVQCGNYDEIEKLACEREQMEFDLDALVDQMAATVEFEENS